MGKIIINTVPWIQRRIYTGEFIPEPGTLIDLRHSYHKKGVFIAVEADTDKYQCRKCDLFTLCMHNDYAKICRHARRKLCWSPRHILVFKYVDKMLEDL